MLNLLDMALTVEEREHKQFVWVLLEAAHDSPGDNLHFRHFSRASRPEDNYADALVLGMMALRRLV